MALGFARLTDIPADELLRVLNDPRLARHMPLWGEFTASSVVEWAAAKTADYDATGLGPRAVMVDGVFTGWAGIQSEDYGPDLAVVLSPDAWGIGTEVTRALLAEADARAVPEVFIALPPSRHSDAVVSRLGFTRIADDVDGFILYRRELPRES
jgi:hypothetical protein